MRDHRSTKALDDVKVASEIGAERAVGIQGVCVIAIESEDTLQEKDHLLKRRFAERYALRVETPDKIGDERIPLPRNFSIEGHSFYHITVPRVSSPFLCLPRERTPDVE